MLVLLWQILRTGMNSDAEDPWRHAMWVGAVMYLIVASGSVATRHWNISKGRLHTSHRPIVLFDGGCVMCNGLPPSESRATLARSSPSRRSSRTPVNSFSRSTVCRPIRRPSC